MIYEKMRIKCIYLRVKRGRKRERERERER